MGESRGVMDMLEENLERLKAMVSGSEVHRSPVAATDEDDDDMVSELHGGKSCVLRARTPVNEVYPSPQLDDDMDLAVIKVVREYNITPQAPGNMHDFVAMARRYTTPSTTASAAGEGRGSESNGKNTATQTANAATAQATRCAASQTLVPRCCDAGTVPGSPFQSSKWCQTKTTVTLTQTPVQTDLHCLSPARQRFPETAHMEAWQRLLVQEVWAPALRRGTFLLPPNTAASPEPPKTAVCTSDKRRGRGLDTRAVVTAILAARVLYAAVDGWLRKLGSKEIERVRGLRACTEAVDKGGTRSGGVEEGDDGADGVVRISRSMHKARPAMTACMAATTTATTHTSTVNPGPSLPLATPAPQHPPCASSPSSLSFLRVPTPPMVDDWSLPRLSSPTSSISTLADASILPNTTTTTTITADSTRPSPILSPSPPPDLPQQPQNHLTSRPHSHSHKHRTRSIGQVESIESLPSPGQISDVRPISGGGQTLTGRRLLRPDYFSQKAFDVCHDSSDSTAPYGGGAKEEIYHTCLPP